MNSNKILKYINESAGADELYSKLDKLSIDELRNQVADELDNIVETTAQKLESLEYEHEDEMMDVYKFFLVNTKYPDFYNPSQGK